jgi:hypothetical protein
MSAVVAVIRRCAREGCQVTFRVASERSRRRFCAPRCQVRHWRAEHAGPVAQDLAAERRDG